MYYKYMDDNEYCRADRLYRLTGSSRSVAVRLCGPGSLCPARGIADERRQAELLSIRSSLLFMNTLDASCSQDLNSATPQIRRDCIGVQQCQQWAAAERITGTSRAQPRFRFTSTIGQERAFGLVPALLLGLLATTF